MDIRRLKQKGKYFYPISVTSAIYDPNIKNADEQLLSQEEINKTIYSSIEDIQSDTADIKEAISEKVDKTDLVNYAKLDTDNTFTGTNTFKSNVIKQVLDVESVKDFNIGYVSSFTSGTMTASAAFNPYTTNIQYTDSSNPDYLEEFDCGLIGSGYLGLALTTTGIDNTNQIILTPSKLNVYLGDSNMMGLAIDEKSTNHYFYINKDSGDEGTTFYHNHIKFDNTTLNYSDIATKVTSTTSSDSAITLKPNANVDITCSGDLTITLQAPADTSVVNVYMCTITTSGDSGTVTLPSDVTWNKEITIEASSFYEINIRYSGGSYFGIIHKWSND